MELRHLRYFVAVADELHFTRAAEKLNISTPTLSVQIREIERRLGTEVFVRDRRSVALTAAGEVFLNEARAVLARFERAESIGRLAAQGKVGRLAIGYVGTAAYAGILQERVRGFRSGNPDVVTVTREVDMDDLPDLVIAREIDVGFVRMPMELPPGLVCRTILEDRFCLALPQSHRLAVQADDPSPEQLADEPLVVPEQLAGTHEVAMRGRFDPRIVARPGRMAAVLIEVSFGTGVAIVPSSVRDVLRLPGLAYRNLAGPPIASEIAAIRRDEIAPLTAAFVEQFDA